MQYWKTFVTLAGTEARSVAPSAPDRGTLTRQLKRLHPAVGTDSLLALLIGLTVVSLTVSIAGRPLSLTDLLLVPVLFVLVFSRERAKLPTPFFLVSLLYLLWCTLALGWAPDLAQSAGTLVQYVEFFFLVPLAFIYVRTLRGVVAIVNAYIFSATVLAVLAVAFAVATRTFSYLFFLDYQKNVLGAFAANAIVLAAGMMILAKGSRGLYVAAIVLNAAALFFSSSRGSMLGLIVGFVVFLLLIRRIRYGIMLTIAGSTFVWIYSQLIDPAASSTLTDFSADSSAGSRWMIWDHAVGFITQSPWIGQGVGSYLIRIPSIGFQQADPSNVFLLNLAEVGVIGLVLFCLLLLVVAAHAVRNARLFEGNWAYLVLSATLMAAFASHIAHVQIDVAWVRGTGVFAFACVGLLLKLRELHARDTTAGTLPV